MTFHIAKQHKLLDLYTLYKMKRDNHNYPYLDKLHTGTYATCLTTKATLETEAITERKQIIRRYKQRKIYKAM